MLSRLRNINVLHKEKLSRLEKFAVLITNQVGSVGFFLILIGWTFFWILWNMIVPLPWRFDPFPAFVLWLFISNMLQLFLLPLLMIGQNLQNRHAELRAEADYETNLHAEQEIAAMLERLKKQEEILNEIKQRLK